CSVLLHLLQYQSMQCIYYIYCNINQCSVSITSTAISINACIYYIYCNINQCTVSITSTAVSINAVYLIHLLQCQSMQSIYYIDCNVYQCSVSITSKLRYQYLNSRLFQNLLVLCPCYTRNTMI